MKEFSFKEACKEYPLAAKLWEGFNHALNDPTNWRPNPTFILQHCEIMQTWAGDWQTHLIDDAKLIQRRLETIIEIYGLVDELKESRPPVTISGKTTVNAALEEQIGFWLGRAKGIDVSEKEQSRHELDSGCCRAFTIEINDAVAKVLERLGVQQGPKYFRDPDSPIYSGPQNPPLKPSGDKDFIMSESECWCAFCNVPVPKTKEDLMKPCEQLTHKCTDGNFRMVCSKVTMPDDKRVYDYGNVDRSIGQKP